MKRRPCTKCQRNRAERFFTSKKGKVCADCRKASSRKLARTTHLQTNYGISHDEYEALLAAQSQACAICRGIRRGSYDVDHDHRLEKRLLSEGKEPLEARRESIRGLLCRRCNRRLLPATLDDTKILQGAIDYIMNPPARHIL